MTTGSDSEHSEHTPTTTDAAATVPVPASETTPVIGVPTPTDAPAAVPASETAAEAGVPSLTAAAAATFPVPASETGGEAAVPTSTASTSAPAIGVLLVDDHPMWRDAVARDLSAAGYRVVAAVGEGRAALRAAPATRPEVAVVDLHLPDLTGVEVITGLLTAVPGLRVLVLSASGEHQDVLDAVKAGASGYLLKSAGAAEFLDAVARTAAGDAVFTAGLAALVLGEFRRLAATPRDETRAEIPQLTDRETEVLRLVAKGLTYRQIADRLVLSHRTVQNHVQNTLGKLQLHNRVELVRYALENGLGED